MCTRFLFKEADSNKQIAVRNSMKKGRWANLGPWDNVTC